MKALNCLFASFICPILCFTQNTGIGTTNPTAKFEIYDSTSSVLKKAFLVRGNYLNTNLDFPIYRDTLFHISNNGNVGIGSGWPSAKLDIFGNFDDSILLELHGSPTRIFGNEAVLRFSDGYLNRFDIRASFSSESPLYDRLQIGNLFVNKNGVTMVGFSPAIWYTKNSFTITHNAEAEAGVPLAIHELSSKNPVGILLANGLQAVTNWKLESFATDNADSSTIFFNHNSGSYSIKHPIIFTGSGKVGINTNAVSAQSQLEINGQNKPGTTPLTIIGAQEYADNATATAAGLPIGAIYRTGDLLKIVH